MSETPQVDVDIVVPVKNEEHDLERETAVSSGRVEPPRPPHPREQPALETGDAW